MHTCCNSGPAPSKSILSVDGRDKDVVVATDHRESDGNFDKDHRTNPSNLSFIRETIPLVARLPGWPNYTEKTQRLPFFSLPSSEKHEAPLAFLFFFFGSGLSLSFFSIFSSSSSDSRSFEMEGGKSIDRFFPFFSWSFFWFETRKS